MIQRREDHWAKLRRVDCAATESFRRRLQFLPTILPGPRSLPGIEKVQRSDLALHPARFVLRLPGFAALRNTRPRRKYPRTPAVARFQQRTPIPTCLAA